MISLPNGFLPFDPNHDYDRNEDEDEEESSPESDDESNEDLLDNSTGNNDPNPERTKNRHIGGGVILVSRALSLHMLAIWFNRVPQVNVFLSQCWLLEQRRSLPNV